MPSSRDRQVKRRYEADLLEMPGVCGVGLGLKTEDGRRTEDTSIVVYVASSAAAEALPATLQGIPVSAVLAEGVFKAGSGPTGRPRIRPVQGGLAIGERFGTVYGTLGTVVADQAGSAAVLTTYHTLFIRGPTCAVATSAVVVQQPALDGGIEIIASVERAVFHPGSAGQVGIDAVVATIPPAVPATFTIKDYGDLHGFAAPEVDAPVTMAGAGTGGLSYGIINAVDVTLDIEYEFGTYQFFGQVVIEPTPPSTQAATSGDSGALWINASGKAVGMNIAFNSTTHFAIAQPMSAVTERMKFTVPSRNETDRRRIYRVKGD